MHGLLSVPGQHKPNTDTVNLKTRVSSCSSDGRTVHATGLTSSPRHCSVCCHGDGRGGGQQGGHRIEMEVSLSGSKQPESFGRPISGNLSMGPVSDWAKIIASFLGRFNFENWQWFRPPPRYWEARPPSDQPCAGVCCVLFPQKFFTLLPSSKGVLFNSVYNPLLCSRFWLSLIGMSIRSFQKLLGERCCCCLCRSAEMDARQVNNECEGKNVCVCACLIHIPQCNLLGCFWFLLDC